MQESTMIRKHVGLDVHKVDGVVAVADAGGGEVRHVASVSNEVGRIAKVLQQLGKPAQLHVTYEAGPTGYGLYRWLVAKRGLTLLGGHFNLDRTRSQHMAGVPEAGAHPIHDCRPGSVFDRTKLQQACSHIRQ